MIKKINTVNLMGLSKDQIHSIMGQACNSYGDDIWVYPWRYPEGRRGYGYIIFKGNVAVEFDTGRFWNKYLIRLTRLFK